MCSHCEDRVVLSLILILNLRPVSPMHREDLVKVVGPCTVVVRV